MLRERDAGDGGGRSRVLLAFPGSVPAGVLQELEAGVAQAQILSSQDKQLETPHYLQLPSLLRPSQLSTPGIALFPRPTPDSEGSSNSTIDCSFLCGFSAPPGETLQGPVLLSHTHSISLPDGRSLPLSCIISCSCHGSVLFTPHPSTSSSHFKICMALWLGQDGSKFQTKLLGCFHGSG